MCSLANEEENNSVSQFLSYKLFSGDADDITSSFRQFLNEVKTNQKSIDYLKYFVKLLTRFAYLRIKQWDIVLSLIEMAQNIFNDPNSQEYKEVLNALINNPLLNEIMKYKKMSDNESGTDILLNILKKESKEGIILMDDIEKLESFLNKNEQGKEDFMKEQSDNHTINIIFNNGNNNKSNATMLQISALFGSFHIFKAFTDILASRNPNFNFTTHTIKMVIAGGSEEIMEYLKQKDLINMELCLCTCNEYHRYKWAKDIIFEYYLKQSMSDEDINISDNLKQSYSKRNLCISSHTPLIEIPLSDTISACFDNFNDYIFTMSDISHIVQKIKIHFKHIDKLFDIFNLPLLEYLIRNNTKFDININYILHQSIKNGYINFVILICQNQNKLDSFKDEEGNTPLHTASKENQLEIVKYICDNYSELLTQRNKRKNLPIHCSLQCNDIKILQYLVDVKSARIWETGMAKHDTMMIAIEYKNYEAIKYLFGEKEIYKMISNDDSKNNDKTQSNVFKWIERALNSKQSCIATYILENYPEIKSLGTKTNISGETLLSIACRNDDIHNVEKMYEMGFSTGIDKDGFLPIHNAAMYGCVQVFSYLIKVKNVDYLSKSFDNRNILHIACQYGRSNIVIYCMEDLKDNIISLFVEDKNRKTPLQYAQEKLKSKRIQDYEVIVQRLEQFIQPQ